MAELAPGATGEPSPFTSAAGRWLDRIATWWALFGGLIFCAIVVMSIISIVGTAELKPKFNTSPSL